MKPASHSVVDDNHLFRHLVACVLSTCAGVEFVESAANADGFVVKNRFTESMGGLIRQLSISDGCHLSSV